MTPAQAHARAAARPSLTPAEDAILRSVLYASLFDYPLTLAELRQTLIRSRQTASEILATVRGSAALQSVVESSDIYFFPVGCSHLIDTRRRRETRSRAFLSVHRPLLRLIAACPYVRLVALSGSIAHLNLEAGGDLDLFIVTRGRRVWSIAVLVVVLARLLGRRRTLCANLIVSDEALTFAPTDLFTASQVIGLTPIAGADMFQRLLDANPFVGEYYPNFHAADRASARLRRGGRPTWIKCTVETVLYLPSVLTEILCRSAYGRYLKRRSTRWESPDQVVLGDCVLKLHTRSHRADVLERFEHALHDALE